MRKHILALLFAVACWALPTEAAIIPQITLTQTTNAVLTWPSIPSDRFMVMHRKAFHPSTPWKLLATNYPAGPSITTTFTHVGAFFQPSGATVLNTNGGGGSPPGPSALTVAPGTTDPSTANDKVKPKDAPSAPPALPDAKELERELRELLKQWEKEQKLNGNAHAPVQAFSSLAAFTLADHVYTNFPGGFYIISRATDDTDADGLPDWWEALYGLNLLVDDANGDPDGDHVPNLAEYNYGTWPTNQFSRPFLQLKFDAPVTLYWPDTYTYLTWPIVQISGSINLNLRTVACDITNAAGVQNGLEGFVTRRIANPGLSFTNATVSYTNSFQCFDVPLTNGMNYLTLRFADAYGYIVTNVLSFFVDLNGTLAPPVASQFWPTNGVQLGSDTFTVRGRLDNPTASVVARMTFNGEEQEFGGLVERDGTFWIESLPAPSSGPLTLVFTDASGKSSTNTIAVSRSPVSVTLDNPTGTDLWNKTMNLSGSVSHANYSVWVNSVRATVTNGIWTASNVPVNAGGVASFSLRAVANSDNGGAGSGAAAMTGSSLSGLYSPPSGNPNSASGVDAAFDFDKPPRIVVSSYTMRFQDDIPTYATGFTNRQTWDWKRSGDGYSGNATAYWLSPQGYSSMWWYTQAVTYPFPGTNGTMVTTTYDSFGVPHPVTNLVGSPSIPWQTGEAYQRTSTRTYASKVITQLELQTGGRAYSGAASLYEFNGSAIAYNAEGVATNLAPDTLRLMEQALDAAGYTYRTNLPANTTLALTFAAMNAAAQVPPTAQPSTGANITYSISNGDIQLRLTHPPYYRRPPAAGAGNLINTLTPPLYLGYGTFVFPYELAFRFLPDGLQTTIVGAEPLLIRYQQFNNFQLGEQTIQWNGVVPQKQVGITWVNQRLNTRQFINPQLTGLRVQVDAWRGLAATNKTTLKQPAPPIRVVGKAVVARNTVSGGAHLATIAGHLQTMGHTVDTEDGLLMNNLTNRVQHGLVWYSISHAVTNATGFVGVDLRQTLGANHTLVPAELPAGLNYSLVFLNGCGSVMDGNGVSTGFAQRFGAGCAVVGWETPTVLLPVAESVAVTFFDALTSGRSVQGAVDEVHRLQGNDQVHNLLPIFVKDVFKVLTNGHVIIDLTR